MPKYHKSPDGAWRRCSVTVQECRYGGSEAHVSSIEEARLKDEEDGTRENGNFSSISKEK